MKKTILLFFFLMTLQFVIAQDVGLKNGLAVRADFVNYQFPLINQIKTDDFTFGMEVEYFTRINNILNLSIPFEIAKVNLPTNEDGGYKSLGMASLDANLQLHYFKNSSFVHPYLFAGFGAIFENFEDIDFAVPLGMGANFKLKENFYLTTKGEYRIGFSDLRNNIQLGTGFMLILGKVNEEPEILDRDGDGVADDRDLCPDVPGLLGLGGCPDKDGDGISDGDDECPDVPGTIEMKGCPDTDGDGIADKEDDCPTEAGLKENNGCPVRDADGDGIPDESDDCPNEAGSLSANGCPDADGDGIVDKDDECPDAPGLKKNNGCPDTDGDGVVDKDDKCPNSYGPASNRGCPEIEEEDQEILNFATQAVEFETASSRIKTESFSVLDQVAGILKKYKDYSVKIGGHTDSVGSTEANQKLSDKRAKACYDYLLSVGVPASRMQHQGFGESKPIATNMYKDGRAKNRRVEFELYLD